MGLVVLFMGTITLFYLFSTGQISADKQRVTNAADAAAYSAALWRARVLNYDAYSNRAMIANEVAIAQTLTLTSETQYLKNFVYCLAQQPSDDNGVTCSANITYLGYIFPYVQEIVGAVGDLLSIYDGILKPISTGEVEARSNIMNRALSLSQTVLDASTNFEAVQQTIVKQVTTANDSHFTAAMLPDTFAGPGGFTNKYTGDDRIRTATLVREGLDPYSKDREFTIPPIPECLLPYVTITKFKKRGGTTLDTSLDRWEAADDLSEWDSILTIKGCNRTESPMGWGDRQASDGTSDQDTGHVNDNPQALDYARESTYQPAGYIGIQPFRDLNYAGLNGSDPGVKNPTAVLGVVTHLGGGNLRTANTLNIGVGRLRMTENLDRNELSSVAAAEVYFQRPIPRTDGRIEYPSLFNPYWQARLTEPTVAQRAEALVL
jgi:hypothetical protein